MKPIEFGFKYKNQIDYLVNCLKSNNITLTKQYNGNPYIGFSFIDGEPGIYFKIEQKDILSYNQKEIIANIFPIEIKKRNNVYLWNILFISDYNRDNDKYWKPSISVQLIKNGKPI